MTFKNGPDNPQQGHSFSMLTMLQNAVAAHQSGNLAAAEQLYLRVLAADRNQSDALHFLGVLEAQRGNNERANELIGQSLTLERNRPEVFVNHARVLNALNRHQEALEQCNAALRMRPGYIEAFTLRGNALRALHRFDEALAQYDAALTLKPDYVVALANRGHALIDMSRFEEAFSAFNKAFALRPSYELVEGARLACMLHLGNWREFDAATLKVIKRVESGEPTIDPLTFLAVCDTPGTQLACTQIWMKHYYPPAKVPLCAGHARSHNKIRVAYISVDFRDHVVSYLTVGMFEHHDRTQFEIIAISLAAPVPSPIRSRLLVAFDRFLDVADQSDQEIADLIHRLEVDILVDLTGITRHARLGILARRPAPIQIMYLGYPGSAGASYYDYLFCDRVLIPEVEMSAYSEQLIYLPSQVVNDSKREISDRKRSRREVGLPDNAFVFCCLTATYKIRPGIFDIWMRLLSKHDNSVIWLTARDLSTQNNLRSEAAARGVAPSRLVFVPYGQPYAEYLAGYRLADLFLDTSPMTGGATATDALWAGLPIVTCVGNSFPGRIAASQLRAVGLPELITTSLQEYESVALQLARNPAQLASIRDKLARNRLTCDLFDTDRFTKHIEAAYRAMWERMQAGQPPAHFSVCPVGR
jgi:predicted O-linked N-acetylglucosamine transferase (SPINDLY family)